MKLELRDVTSILLVVALVLVSFVAPANALHPSVVRPADLGEVNFTVGAAVATEPYGFWSLRLTGTGGALTHTLAAEINSTPSVYLRYGGGGDATNSTPQVGHPGGCFYNDAGACGSPLYNYSQVKTFCSWLRVGCSHFIFQVPAESNDSGLVADTVKFVEQTVGITPGFWSVGNEPNGWTHFNIKPMTAWQVTDNAAPTPAQFAAESKHMVSVIRSVDPTTPILGTQDSGGLTSPNRVGLVGHADGNTIAGIGFHSYPGNTKTPNTVAQFLQRTNETQTERIYTSDVAALHGNGSLGKVFVNEWNGALGNLANPYLDGSYADGVMFMAEASQLLVSGCQMMTFFALNGNGDLSLINTTTGDLTPTFELLQNLSSVPMDGSVFNVTATLDGTSTAPPDTWAFETSNTTTRALVVVDGNVSGMSVNVPVNVAGANTTGYLMTAAEGGGASTATDFPAGEGNAVPIPPESVLVLVNNSLSAPAGEGHGSGGNGSGGSGGGGGGGVLPTPATLSATDLAVGFVVLVGVGVVVAYRQREVM